MRYSEQCGYDDSVETLVTEPPVSSVQTANASLNRFIGFTVAQWVDVDSESYGELEKFQRSFARVNDAETTFVRPNIKSQQRNICVAPHKMHIQDIYANDSAAILSEHYSSDAKGRLQNPQEVADILAPVMEEFNMWIQLRNARFLGGLAIPITSKDSYQPTYSASLPSGRDKETADLIAQGTVPIKPELKGYRKDRIWGFEPTRSALRVLAQRRENVVDFIMDRLGIDPDPELLAPIFGRDHHITLLYKGTKDANHRRVLYPKQKAPQVLQVDKDPHMEVIDKINGSRTNRSILSSDR